MTDLTVYFILAIVIPGMLVLGIYLRNEIIKFHENYYHRHGHHHKA